MNEVGSIAYLLRFTSLINELIRFFLSKKHFLRVLFWHLKSLSWFFLSLFNQFDNGLTLKCLKRISAQIVNIEKKLISHKTLKFLSLEEFRPTLFFFFFLVGQMSSLWGVYFLFTFFWSVYSNTSLKLLGYLSEFKWQLFFWKKKSVKFRNRT